MGVTFLTNEDYAKMRAQFGPPITSSADGAVVSTTYAASVPAVSVVSAITAVQTGSGDPAPDNVRPISGWNSVSVNRIGKNLLDVNAMESLAVSDDPTDLRYGVKKIYGTGKYTVSCKEYNSDTYIYAKRVKADGSLGDVVYLATSALATQYTFDLAENEGILVYVATAMVSKEHSINIFNSAKVQIELGETATAYDPYSSITLTADLSETVYNGNFDWTTGVLTVTHIGKLLRASDVSYKYGTTYTGWQTSSFVLVSDNRLAAGRLTSICSHFKNTMDTAYNSGSARHGIFSDHPTLRTKYFAWGTPDTTVAEFKAWLEEQYAAGTPVTLVTSLATPYTVQLTPQQLDILKGDNNVWSSTGDTSLTYIVDTKTYIDNAIAALAASVIDV